MESYVRRLYEREQRIERLLKNKPRDIIDQIARDIKTLSKQVPSIVDEKKFNWTGHDVHEFYIYNPEKLLRIYVSFGMGRKRREQITSCRIEVGGWKVVEGYDYYSLRPEQLAISRNNVILYELVLDKLERYIEES